MTSYEVLSPELSTDFPEQWCDLVGTDHFWMRWRFSACVTQLRHLEVPLEAEWRGLEIGCARGVVQSQLEAVSGWVIDGCDLSRSSLAANQATTGRKLLYDIRDRRKELEASYDFLVLFDVLEHIADTTSFLEAALFHLKPGGLVLVNVPALQLLESRYDTAVGHLRRYSRGSLCAALQSVDLAVLDVRYWGLSMVPLLALRKVLMAFQRDEERIIQRGMGQPTGLPGSALEALMRLETRWVGRPFLGTSVLAVGSKVLQ